MANPAATQQKTEKPGGPGRPKGSRNKLSENLHESFQEGGKDVIKRVMEEEPSKYLAIIAAVVPKAQCEG